mgnify:CR=1 FL=1
MSKYLIFGATGSIGTKLAEELYKSNKEIHLIGRNKDELELLSVSYTHLTLPTILLV